MDNIKTVRDFGALIPKWDVLIKPCISELRGLFRSGSSKNVGARGGG